MNTPRAEIATDLRSSVQMLPKEIVAKFAEALKLFVPIEGQPSIRNLTEISEVITQLLLQIPFDET